MKANMSDCPQYLPEFNLLKRTALRVGKKFDVFPKESYYDSMGKWGLRYSQYILLAKKEVCKDGIISCHEEAVLKARIKRIGIVIWIESIKKYMWFDPEVIDRNSQRNYRGSVPFVNFNLSLGRELDW